MLKEHILHVHPLLYFAIVFLSNLPRSRLNSVQYIGKFGAVMM